MVQFGLFSTPAMSKFDGRLLQKELAISEGPRTGECSDVVMVCALERAWNFTWRQISHWHGRGALCSYTAKAWVSYYFQACTVATLWVMVTFGLFPTLITSQFYGRLLTD